MSATYKLFLRWKARKGIESDNAGALSLGLTRATVSQWKQGRNAEIQLIEQLAKDLGEDPARWAAEVMAERGQSAEERRAWQRIARQLGAATAALILCVVALPAPASTFNYLASSATEQCLLCSRVVRRWLLVALRASLARYRWHPNQLQGA